MPKYHLPNGKAVYSEKEIPADQLDDFLEDMGAEPTEPPVSKSLFERSYDTLSTPLTTKPSEWARSISQDWDKPTALGQVHPMAAFGRGAMEGIGDLVSGLSSPGNILLTALTLGQGTAAKMGLSSIIPAMRLGAKAVAAPGVIHGGQTMAGGAAKLGENPWEAAKEMGQGLVEVAGNVAGTQYTPKGAKTGAPKPKVSIEEAAKGYTLEEPKLPPKPAAVTIAPPKPPSKANTIPPGTPPKVTTTPPTAAPKPSIRPLAQIEDELFPLMEKSKTGTITIDELKRGQALNKEWRNHPDFGKDPNTQGGVGDAEKAGSQPYKPTPVPTPAPPPIPQAPPQFSQQVMGEPPPGMFPPSEAYGGPNIPPPPIPEPTIPQAPENFAPQVMGEPTPRPAKAPVNPLRPEIPPGQLTNQQIYDLMMERTRETAPPVAPAGVGPEVPHEFAVPPTETPAPVIPEAPPQFAEQVAGPAPEAPPTFTDPYAVTPEVPPAPENFAPQVMGEPQAPTQFGMPQFKGGGRKLPTPPPIPEGVDPLTGELLNEPVSQEITPFEQQQAAREQLRQGLQAEVDNPSPLPVAREFAPLPPERNVRTEVVPADYTGPGEIVGTLSDGQKVVEFPTTPEVPTEVPPTPTEVPPAKPAKGSKFPKSQTLTKLNDFADRIRSKVEMGEEINEADIREAQALKAEADAAKIRTHKELIDTIATALEEETPIPPPETPKPRLVKSNRLANERGELDLGPLAEKLRPTMEKINRFFADETGEGDIGPAPEPTQEPSVITGTNRDTMVNAPVGHRILVSKQSFRSTPELGVEAAKLGYEFQGTQKGKLLFEKVRESGQAPLLEQDVPQVRKKGEKVNEEIGPIRKVWDLTRGLMSIDPPFVTSAAFRQAAPWIGTKHWFQAWADAAKSFGSETVHKAYMAEINNSPLFRDRPPAPGSRSKKPSPSFAKEIGVRMTEGDRPITARQEGIRSQIAEKIPVYGRYVKASNRAFEAFLNGLRRRQLEAFVKDGKVKAKAFGDSSHDITQNIALAKEFAEFLNDSTGAGTLKTGIGKHQYSLEQHASKMADLFFSPRLMARNIRMLNPSTYIMANPAVRKQYLHAMMRTVGAWWGVAQLAQMAGAEVVTDPNNPDFGKIKIGNTRLDPGAGFQQFLVLGSRTKPAWMTLGNPTQTGAVPLDLATGLMGTPGGQYSSSISGESYQFGEGFNPPTRTSNFMNFMSNKFHPAAKLLWDIGSANERNPVYLGDRLMQMFLPMMTSDLAELAQTDPELIPLVIPWSASGGGSQTYTGEVTGPTLTPLVGSALGIPDLPDRDYVFGNPGGMEDF